MGYIVHSSPHSCQGLDRMARRWHSFTNEARVSKGRRGMEGLCGKGKGSLDCVNLSTECKLGRPRPGRGAVPLDTVNLVNKVSTGAYPAATWISGKAGDYRAG